MTTRQYSSRSQQSTLTSTITSGATTMTVVSGTGLLGGVTIPAGRTFTLVVDPDTALEEIVDATAVSTNTFTITRAIDGSLAQEHSAGAVVRHMAIGRDYRDANLHAEASAYYNDGAGAGHTMHGIGSGEGDVVGTLKTQTLTNKTLTSPIISNPTLTGTPQADASIVFEGTTADAFETTLTVVDPTQDNTITLPNTTGTVVIATATQTLTNKTLTSPVISGSPVITGLSSAGMVASSATPKDYVDSILGSATAAATSAASAATSAASAATSASSAATSASNALTSANSASTSATAAATSAASAATSATAAATSATSAAASATAASTSETNAAASASAAATSASSALTSANSASTSATASASSASASATSATAAATSATSAAASATAAATSATSAAASATAAATSATSAAASATTAANSATAAATSATSASVSAIDANTSAINAATSASSALTSANSASTSASSALTSANSASTSATAAASSATAAETAWDTFDDRYLGPKSSAPTVDNDGNPLTSGVIYWNTTDGNMYVWNGTSSSWVVFTSTGDITAVTVSSPITGGGDSGSVNIAIQAATTSQSGAVQLTDSTSSTSITTAATPNSVKAAYDLAASALAGLHFHDPVETATSSNITLSGLSAVNGYTPIAGDRILVKNQTTQSENGVYVADASTWSRATDFDTWDEVYTSAVYVKQGNDNGESYITTVASTGTVGVTAITFALFATNAVYAAGTGLTLVGTTFSVDTSTIQARVAGVSDTEIGYLDGVTSAIQTQINAKAPTASPTFTGNVGIDVTPTSKLDVLGAVQSSANAAVNDASVGSYNFYNTNSSAAANPIRASINAGRENSAWGAYMSFRTATGTSAVTERMRIAADGATTVSYTTTTGGAVRNIYMSTSTPSGGSDGDVWIQYA